MMSTSTFRALEGRATAATVLVVFIIVANLAFDAVSFAFAAGASQATLEMFGAMGVLLLVGMLTSGIIFLRWFHAAASNLRALHPNGVFTFTPGWCVGWWFVPFANLVKPYHAMREVWQASDPSSQQGSFGHVAVPQLVSLWWGAWIASGLLGNVSGRIEDASAAAALGALSTLCTIVAGASLIKIVSTITRSQAQMHEQRLKPERLRDALQHVSAEPGVGHI